MDRQLKQAALPCRLSGEHFRTHYGAPGADRPLPDVQRRVDVGRGLMPAADAPEGGLIGAVLFVDAATSDAFTRRVAWIDKDHRDTSGAGGEMNDDERWQEVAAVEREIRLCAYASAGDPARSDDMKMYAIWAGRLQRALTDPADQAAEEKLARKGKP